MSIRQTGVDRIILITASAEAEPGLAEQNVARLSESVLPKLRT